MSRWMFAGVLLAVAVVGVVVMPVRYESRAVMLVIPAEGERWVPLEAYAVPMRAALLSKQTLKVIIEYQGLYQPERARIPMEDVIGLMRKDTAVEAAGEGQVVIRYLAASSEEAVRVCRALVERIVLEASEALRESPDRLRKPRIICLQPPGPARRMLAWPFRD